MMAGGDIHACTDITGFGFLGHACEMIEGGDTGMEINSASVPVFEGVRELMETGFVPGGLYRNRKFRISQIEAADTCPTWLLDVFFDPQTAGGLFFSLPGNKAQQLVEKMRGDGIGDAAVVGEVVRDHPGKIFIY
jgi:selenide,water dikinase